MSVERVNMHEMIDFLIRVRRGYVTTGQESYNCGSWGCKFKRQGDLYFFVRDELVTLGGKEVFSTRYQGQIMPDFLPEKLGEETAFCLAKRANNLLNQRDLSDPPRLLKLVEEADVEIEGFPELRYSAEIDRKCLKQGEDGVKRINMDLFAGFDKVEINQGGVMSTLLNGRFLAGRLR